MKRLPASSARARALLWFRIACLPALTASAALTVEYRSLSASFCGPESGCSALRRTDLAYLWGLGPTLPELGLAAFALIFALSLTRLTRVAAGLGIVGGVLGLLLLVQQAVALGTYCWLCVVVDISALAAGICGLLLLIADRRAHSGSGGEALTPQRVPLKAGSWLALGLLAVLAPALWPAVKPTPAVPAAVRAYYQPDKINVVEFADFECPFCRILHHRLKAQLQPFGDRIHFVRLNMPLDRHRLARQAALAAICAEPSGHADELADFLFATEDLSLTTTRSQAARLGVDLPSFDRCLEAPETTERLERERRILHDVGFEGLPTTYIGNERIVGAQSPEVFQEALEVAAREGSLRGVPAWAYLLMVFAATVVIVRTGRSGVQLH